MCDHQDADHRWKGHLMRAGLAVPRMILAGVLTLGVLILLGFLHGRLSHVVVWLLVISVAALGLSVCFGSAMIERTARSLRLNNDWPVEREVSAVACAQKWFLLLAWLLIIAALITGMYTRPGPPRQVRPPMPRPMQQFQGQQPPPPDARTLRSRPRGSTQEFPERRQEPPARPPGG